MFSVEEMNSVVEKADFVLDYSWVKKSLLKYRFEQSIPQVNGEVKRLSHFIEGVLSSSPFWQNDDGISICRIAGEMAELLSLASSLSEKLRSKMRMRAALLYELAEMPALTSAVLETEDFSGPLDDMFFRRSLFRCLGFERQEIEDLILSAQSNSAEIFDVLSHDSIALARFEQGISDAPTAFASTSLAELAKHIQLSMNASELKAFEAVIRKRISYATRNNVSDALFEELEKIKFPAELWRAQVSALNGGLLNRDFDSWGFAAPTGSGKTFLTRLLITQTLKEDPSTKILYIVPTKALVNEVWLDLNKTLSSLDYQVIKVTPQIISLDPEENEKISACSVAVLTPEKADLLLRISSDFVESSSLIIVDEAHHIEAGTRGVLLELYLWRIRKLFRKDSRVVFLSAVAPNILDFASWLGNQPGSVAVDHRSTRMRAGVYRIRKNGRQNEGWIDFADETSILAVESPVEKTQDKKLLQLICAVANAGPVLIVAKGKGTTETLAQKMKDYLIEQGTLTTLSREDLALDEIQRLDSRLEREMYSTVPMRELLQYQVAYHHAGLPPRVRVSVEEAIRKGLVKYVFATTTLAEGVNFPFSTVIIQSLALREPPEKGKPTRYSPVTPRSFWNIAGRAGRPGSDREGQAILFEPSLGLERINAVIENYLDSSLNGVQPVGSALADSLSELSGQIESGDLTLEDLSKVSIPENLSKRARGTVNLLRVGIIHAKASNLLPRVEDMLDSTFAARYLSQKDRETAVKILDRQLNLVNNFLAAPNAPSQEMVAELGLSLETLVELREYVKGMQDWQLERCQSLMYGGTVNIDQVPFIVGPVAARMAELEGPKLGGFYSSVIVNWLEGVPLTTVKSQAKFNEKLENLISVIYSRIQYLLPWGLYAMHELVREECQQRNITSYTDEILSLAYLIDSGVPNFHALRLVNLDFERVDATRLSKAYLRLSPRSMDILGWLVSTDKNIIFSISRGGDNRRLDFDLNRLLDSLSQAQ